MLKKADETAAEEGFVFGHAECQAGWEAVQLLKIVRFPCPKLGRKMVFKF